MVLGDVRHFLHPCLLSAICGPTDEKERKTMFGKRLNFLTFAGIKIGIDISWFFIAILLTWTLAAGYFPHFYPGLSEGMYWFIGVIGMLGLFVCVILHELGHAMVAKHYKMPISQITLFIFGGVAEIKQEPQTPKIEFLMAVAGPAVSFVLVALMYGLTILGHHLGWPVELIAVTGYLTFINLAIVIFNLVPAFPLDGGRIFRAILWGWKKNLGWATKVSTQFGRGFGFFMIFLGIFGLFTGNFLGGFWFIILGFFLQNAAMASRTQYYVGQELRDEKVLKFMTKDPISVSPDSTIKEFVDQYVYQSYHHFYPVASKGKLMGYISLKEVKSLSSEEWKKTLVKKVMVPSSQFQTVSPETSALNALNLMNQTAQPILLVVKGGRLIGILTPQDLFKMISIKFELEN